MQKRLVQATALALLLATMATPAFAHDNDNGKGNAFGKNKEVQGREFGQLMAKLAKEKHEDKEKKEKKDKEEHRRIVSACLSAAQQAHSAAVRTANQAREAARLTARTAYDKALNDARKVRLDVRAAARIAYLASDKGEAAQIAWATAKIKADVKWQADKKAAQDTWTAAKAAAEATWKTAKAKADADFRTAKEKCAAENQPSADVTAPSAVTLSLSGATSSSIVVGWTAPGDDAATGTAASYDLRYSTSAIVTAADFAAATAATGEPAPAVAGTAQSVTVSGLSAGTTYFFAMKAQDEVPNVSAMSNVPSLATL
jgi:membrane protein involved in colicin uptake